MLILHPNDPWVLKEIMSYLESYNFWIHMKGTIINLSHLRVSRTPPWRYGLPYFVFLLCIHFLISFYQILCLEYCRPFWVKWLFWLGLLILAPFQWICFIYPLLLRTSCKKLSMFLKRMSFTIGRTCFQCLCQRLESHFEQLENSIHSPSKSSSRSALE